MLKWLLIIFSLVLVGCEEEIPADFQLEAIQSSEAYQNQDNNRYYIYPKEEKILVDEVDNQAPFDYIFNEYALESYTVKDDSVTVEYNNTVVTFNKLSDSVYTSDEGTWYNFNLNEVDDTVQAENSDNPPGSEENPYTIGETIQTHVRYLDKDLENHKGVIQLSIGDYYLGQEAENYVLNRGDYNKPAPKGLQWFVADMTVSFIEGFNQSPYTVYLPIRVYSSKGLISQFGEHKAVLDTEIKGTILYPQQTGKGKIAVWVPEGNLAEVLFELETGTKSIWFEFEESM